MSTREDADPPLDPMEQRLHAWADGQLPDNERELVEAHLAAHGDDVARVRLWQAQNAALRGLHAPQLEEPFDTARFALPRRRFAAFPRWPVALAASLFVVGMGLGTALGWFGRGMVPASVASTGAALARQAAVAHAVFTPEVRHPVEVGADQEQHLVAWLSKRLGTGLKCPKLAPLGYELVGGRLLAGPNGPVAHFMYQDGRGSRLTLYVSRQRGEPRQTAFRFSQEDKVAVFYWIDGAYGYALSGELPRDTLLAVANSVYQQLNP